MKKCDLTEELVNSNKDKYPRLKHIRFDNNTKGKCLLDNNQLIGIVQVDMKRKYILALEVFEPYKRKGYGTNLLKIAVNELGAEKLSVNKNNKNAISLYNKNMWEIYDEDKNMFYMKTKDAKIYKKGVKESMYEEEYDTEYFDTFLESLDPELESKYSDKVDAQLAKNKDPEYIDQKKLGIITRVATEAIKKMPDKMIKFNISNLKENIKLLEDIAEKNKNDGIFKRILGVLMQAYGGPVKLWRALSVAQVAAESRKILKELQNELARRKSEKKGVKESMEENTIFDTFLEALRAESGLPTVVDPNKSTSVTIQEDNTNTKIDEVQSSYAKLTNDSGIDTPKPTNMENEVASKQTKLDTVDGLKNPTIPDNTCKVQASAAKLESSDFEGEVDLDLIDLDIF